MSSYQLGLHATVALLLLCTALSLPTCPEHRQMVGPSLLQSLRRASEAPALTGRLPFFKDLTAREESLPFFDAPALEGHTLTSELPSAKLGMAFTHYHKSGCDFSKGLAKILSDAGAVYYDEGFDFEKNYSEVEYENGTCSASQLLSLSQVFLDEHELKIFSNPGSFFLLPTGARIVNFYRDPISLILSGYRYHGLGPESWEHEKVTCPRVEEKALNAIFERCHYHCSYFELLNSTSEEEGVIMEALMERGNIQAMQNNMKLWSGSPQVLHVSMEHLATDFNATVSCILRFLDLDNNTLGAAQELDTSSCNSASDEAKCEHATSSRHYDNEGLQILLEQHASWGPEFKAARQMSQAIFQRQASVFGCPVPE